MSSNEEEFKLNLKSHKITYRDNVFDNVNIQLDNANPFYNAYIRIKDIKTSFYDVSEFNLVNKTISDTLFFRTEFKGGKQRSDDYKLNLYHTINKDNKSVFGFKKSKLKINDYEWFINELNDKKSKVVFDKKFKDVTLEQFVVSHNSEFLKLYGELHGDKEKDISLDINEVKLSKLLPEIKHFNFEELQMGNLNCCKKKECISQQQEL